MTLSLEIFLQIIEKFHPSRPLNRPVNWISDDYRAALDQDPKCSPTDYAPELFNYHIDRNEYGRYNTFMTKFERVESFVLTTLVFFSPFIAAKMVGAVYVEDTLLDFSCYRTENCGTIFFFYLGNLWLFVLGLIAAASLLNLIKQVLDDREQCRDAIMQIWKSQKDSGLC